VADEDYRAVLVRNRPLCGGNVIRQGDGRILNNCDVISVSLQDFVESFPSRPVHETAMNENNILYCHFALHL
jgi:hypothetical protein